MVRDPLPQTEFEEIFSKVPRLTVEVVITSEAGILLALRDMEPCKGTWNIPGGTVRFGEPLTEAVRRVAKSETGLEVEAGHLLGYIEYPSHYEHGMDSPVGIAFRAKVVRGHVTPNDKLQWFRKLPDTMHDEQKEFLQGHVL